MDQLKIGWARREISMEGPVSIPGQWYTRLSEGIHDPVYVTALCIDGGEGQDAVIFCSCDIVNVRVIGYQAVLEALRKKNAPFPLEWVVLHATHTHASIDVNNISDTAPDGAYRVPGEKSRAFFAEQASEAILEAYRSRKPGKISFGYGYAVVAHSRRVIYMDDVSKRTSNEVAPNGHGVMYGQTRDDMFSHYEAGADHTLNAVYTFDEADKLTGIVVNVPCPSQLSEHFVKLSADYWHDVRLEAAKAFGEDVYILPQCAAAGDLSPRTLHYKEAQARRMRLKYGLGYQLDPTQGHGAGLDKAGRVTEDHYRKVIAERKDIAERIIESVKEIYAWAQKEKYAELPVKHVYETADYERRRITDEDVAWCKDAIEFVKKTPPTETVPEEYRVSKSTYDAVLECYEEAIDTAEELKTRPTLQIGTHVIRLGEISFVTTPFELYMDYMHRIQARSPFVQTFLVQLCGDACGGYLATERGVANKGYSATIFDNNVSPAAGQQYVENSLKLLEKLKKD